MQTGTPNTDNDVVFSPAYTKGDNKYVLRMMTIRDAWGNDFYYHSAPPYQSYRLVGRPDGVTFSRLSATATEHFGPQDRERLIKDDIARPSR